MRRNLIALKGLCIDSPVDTHSGLWWWISGWGGTRDIQGGTDLHCAGARTAGTVAIALLSAPLPCSSQTGTSSLCPPCHMVNSESVLAGEIFPLHPVFSLGPSPTQPTNYPSWPRARQPAPPSGFPMPYINWQVQLTWPTHAPHIFEETFDGESRVLAQVAMSFGLTMGV